LIDGSFDLSPLHNFPCLIQDVVHQLKRGITTNDGDIRLICHGIKTNHQINDRQIERIL